MLPPLPLPVQPWYAVIRISHYQLPLDLPVLEGSFVRHHIVYRGFTLANPGDPPRVWLCDPNGSGKTEEWPAASVEEVLRRHAHSP